MQILKKIFVRSFTILIVLVALNSSFIFSQTFDASGIWICPNNVYSVHVDIWGGGGGGSTRTSNGGGGGGGGGAYVGGNVSVTPGTAYTVTIGGESQDSWFKDVTTALAKGGNSVANNVATGGTGGLASASIIPVGGVKYDGGNGFTSGGTDGGGGGAAA